MSNKQKGKAARFLNFNFQTSQTNSGIQQYGAGQTQNSGKRNANRSTKFGPVTLGDEFGRRGARNIGRNTELISGTGGVVRPVHHEISRTILKGSELIQTISGSNSFDSESIQVQPGMASTFPWLSQVAKLYQKYRFHKLEFLYKPLVGVFSPDALEGKVGLAMDLDALADDLDSIEVANLLDPNVSGLLTQTLCLPLDCRAVDPRYIRTGVMPPGSDIKSYDVAKLFAFKYATANSNAIGELHVAYEIELIGPILHVTGAPVANHHVVSFENLLTATATTGALVDAPLATPLLAGFPIANVAGVITLPPAIYRLTWSCLVTIAGGTLSTFNMEVWIAGVLSTTFPVATHGHAAGATVVDCDTIAYSFRIDEESSIQFKRSVTVSAGTCVATDQLCLQAIEA